jgi:ribosome-associated protein
VLDIGASRPLPPSELEFRATRSGGPGGQHVNTSSTRVELVFDLEASPTLTAGERERARRRLRSRLDAEGRLRVVAQDERSQYRNRRLATERFCEIMRAALAPPPPPRRPSRPTRASTEERLESKRRDATRKRMRRPPADADDRAEAHSRAA